MVIKPDDLNNKKFSSKVFGGYKKDDVNNYIDDLVNNYENLYNENIDLKAKLENVQNELNEYAKMKEALNQSIITAQEAAERVTTNAQKEASIISNNAENQAKEMLNDSTSKSNQILKDASEKAREITIETDQLKNQTDNFRSKLQMMLEQQLELVKNPKWTEIMTDVDSSNVVKHLNDLNPIENSTEKIYTNVENNKDMDYNDKSNNSSEGPTDFFPDEE